MKRLTIMLIALASLMNMKGQWLQISDNQRYIQYADGKPFIWIGDTAWELFHKLDKAEADEYLTTRKAQGFTIIQAVVLAELDGLKTPNAYGHVPLIDLDPARPNEAYFEHVDYIIKKANELGLVMGILPTWGDKLYSVNPGAGPVVFNAENARKYGEFLGERYKNKNIVWILGGDRTIDNKEVLQIWRTMADGIKAGDGGKHLMTFHPRGGYSSSAWLHNEPWLDFNMYQSGHAQKFNHVYEYAETDYLMLPAKPFLDGEPAYEDIAVKFWEYMDFSDPRRVPPSVLNEQGLIENREHFEDGFFTDDDIRVHAYWNFLSGACGYTYGNNAVWQMFRENDAIVLPTLKDWREALSSPGANQMKHLYVFLEKYPVSEMVPDQSIIYGKNPTTEEHIRAARSREGKWLAIYLSQGQKVNVVMSKIAHAKVKAYWYNPKNGNETSISAFTKKDIQAFVPPTNGIGNDWLLILEGD